MRDSFRLLYGGTPWIDELVQATYARNPEQRNRTWHELFMVNPRSLASGTMRSPPESRILGETAWKRLLLRKS